MNIPGEVWAELIEDHPFEYKFEGLDGWHKDVREACVQDERFMDDWMERERESVLEALDEELRSTPPKEGQEDDPYIESYADFLRRKRWHEWDEPENMNHAPARKVIEKLEPKEPIKSLYHPAISAENLRDEWSGNYCEPSEQWDFIKQDEPDYYLGKHPPVELRDTMGGGGIPTDDIYFFCPECGYPVRESDMTNGTDCPYCDRTFDSTSKEELEIQLLRERVELWPFEGNNTMENVETNMEAA